MNEKNINLYLIEYKLNIENWRILIQKLRIIYKKDWEL